MKPRPSQLASLQTSLDQMCEENSFICLEDLSVSWNTGDHTLLRTKIVYLPLDGYIFTADLSRQKGEFSLNDQRTDFKGVYHSHLIIWGKTIQNDIESLPIARRLQSFEDHLGQFSDAIESLKSQQDSDRDFTSSEINEIRAALKRLQAEIDSKADSKTVDEVAARISYLEGLIGSVKRARWMGMFLRSLIRWGSDPEVRQSLGETAKTIRVLGEAAIQQID